eukprot:scaffold244055_cov17-Prasinocladus_malaysianus.AAC.1
MLKTSALPLSGLWIVHTALSQMLGEAHNNDKRTISYYAKAANRRHTARRSQDGHREIPELYHCSSLSLRITDYHTSHCCYASNLIM